MGDGIYIQSSFPEKGVCYRSIPPYHVKREVFEETGLIVDEMELFQLYSGEEQHYTYPNGDEVYIINIVHLSREFHGVLEPDPAESREIKFFNRNNLTEKITPTNVPILRELKNRIYLGNDDN